eukprot:CAMPEP_0113649964 /NCGR_PEP_ID=MMETSP0017_2-20120614/26570_1 /TAXON_ID=2856 /ORGANISM="Cylindrotheca closterium" /LENGTH=869 /DNA_ID=CAMNT_0000562413 /DNA_START=55 /DNA_END=2664 /DNA_ORIENTATION=- /assembly_acc=CAM_ASM_000147
MKLTAGGLALSYLAAGAYGSSSSMNSGKISKAIFENKDTLLERREEFAHRRTLQVEDLELTFLKPSSDNLRSNNQGHRQLDQKSCDVAFFDCIPNDVCVDCFTQLELNSIDWAGVTPETTCDDVVRFLNDKGHCPNLSSDSAGKETFCNTFRSCVVWKGFGENDDMVPDEGDEDFVNCTALTECSWPGMHENWLGDGVCHDNLHGCYNTELCGWDGGDCCEDKCGKNTEVDIECGHDGFACRDPTSANCDPSLTKFCPNDPAADEDVVECGPGEQMYRLMMYDSFGDGWDTTKVTIKLQGTTKAVFSGGLPEGSYGVEQICLSKEPACYSADTGGGVWGIESSWEIKPAREGPAAIAGSGSPNSCVFNVAGGQCENTCYGRPDYDPTQDPEYKEFKKMETCIEDKCLIQLGACREDSVCQDCFREDLPDYCFNDEAFNAVMDCAICKCTERKVDAFCKEKPSPGANLPDKEPDSDKVQHCTPAENQHGTDAVLWFSQCSEIDQIAEMITEFDQNNFGQLDTFESCAHSYADEANHGGHTALGCMQVLYNTMTNPITDNPSAPKQAISSLARHLYEEGETFCDCAKSASEMCPMCPSFQKFKTLLYESMDACKSLDEIDCAAWSEFWQPCKNNLQAQFGSSDFSSKDQCEFAIFNTCGGVGPFPGFRRLDCDKEVSSEAWDFYKTFSKNCKDGMPTLAPATPVSQPTSAPVTSAPIAQPTTPTQTPYVPPDASPTLKPYVPPDASPTVPYNPPPEASPTPSPIANPTPYIPSDQTADANGGEPKKSSHFFRNFFILCLLGGGGYYVYKKRFATFNFVQYRRRGYNMMYNRQQPGGYSGESEMFSNLNSSTTFEPPTLPPTPAAMMGTEMT